MCGLDKGDAAGGLKTSSGSGGPAPPVIGELKPIECSDPIRSVPSSQSTQSAQSAQSGPCSMVSLVRTFVDTVKKTLAFEDFCYPSSYRLRFAVSRPSDQTRKNGYQFIVYTST